MRRDALIGLAVLLQASPAFAHAFLERASPPVGSEVAVSPPELSITFTEGVEPLFSTIQVGGANGAAIATGKPHVAPDSNRQLIVTLPKLPPGLHRSKAAEPTSSPRKTRADGSPPALAAEPVAISRTPNLH